MAKPRTLFDKIWESHLVDVQADGTCLIFIDRHIIHEITSAQAFEGVCIARSGAGANASFTVRKISYGEGVERIFPLHSPRIAGIDVVRRGDVRRAKLYFLRERRGKSARIAEKIERRLGLAAAGQPPATAREAEAEIAAEPTSAASTPVQAAPAGEPKLSKKERRAAKAEAAGKARGKK